MKTVVASVVSVAVLASLSLGMAWADDVSPERIVELVEDGSIRDPRDLNRVVLELHPGATVHSTELEEEYGRFVYEVELVTADGEEWDVKLDAASGEVLKNRRDD